VISLVISRVIIDELHELERAQRELEAAVDADSSQSASRLPRRRCSHVLERHAHLIYLYLMVDLGYGLPDLDELLLWAIEEPNPHRGRLREQVESGET
jgi:putative transposase